MRTTSLVLLLLLLNQSGRLNAQAPQEQPRNWSIYSGVGITEFFVFGGLYQASDALSVAGKFTFAGLGGTGSFLFPTSGVGIGTKATYYFDSTGRENFLGFNTINFEASVLQHSTQPNKHALAFEASIGHDSIVGFGLGVIFAIGASQTFLERRFAYGFVLKLGIHYNI